MKDLINIEKLKEDLADLVDVALNNGEHNGFRDIDNDFLSIAFSELIASDSFSKFSPDRRKDLFLQFEILQITLNGLQNFVYKYPDGFKLQELMREKQYPVADGFKCLN